MEGRGGEEIDASGGGGCLHLFGGIIGPGDTHQVHDLDEPKQRLTKVWHGLRQSDNNDAMNEWHKRLWAYVHVKAGHLEHLI